MAQNAMPSGFLNHDYILTFSVRSPDRRQRLIELCEGAWQGDRVTDFAWEVSNDLSPDDMETALLGIIEEGDQVAYYYLTPPMPSPAHGEPDAKRIFRVVIA